MGSELKGAVPFEDGMIDMYRNHSEMAVAMLNQCLEEGDAEMLLVTLRQIAKACGMSEMAEGIGLNGQDSGQNLKVLMGISDALGSRLAFVPKKNLSA